MFGRFFHRKPDRRRRFLRFGLASILLLMVPLGFSFVWLRNYLDNRSIHWVPYSANALDQNLREGRTVLINFRATWDMNVVMHEPMALETPEVTRWIRSRGVVAMRADYTEGSPEIKAALQAIDQKAIPVVAVYPASSPTDPIVLSGRITEEQVIQALESAGRSR